MTLGSSKAYESVCVSFVIENLEIKLKFTNFFFLTSSLRLCCLYSCSMYFSSLKFLTFTYLKGKFTLPRCICRGADSVPCNSVFVNSMSFVVVAAVRSLQFNCASPFKPEVPSQGPVSSIQIHCVMENEIPMVLYNVGMAFS